MVLVSPRLQRRVMTTKVGPIVSVGFVSLKTIVEGETHPNFNNFGGQDRYWLGPEAGQYGIYFAPGADYDRKVWQVPPDYDKGPFKVEQKSPGKVQLSRDIASRIHRYRFKARAEEGPDPGRRPVERAGRRSPRRRPLLRLVLREPSHQRRRSAVEEGDRSHQYLDPGPVRARRPDRDHRSLQVGRGPRLSRRALLRQGEARPPEGAGERGAPPGRWPPQVGPPDAEPGLAAPWTSSTSWWWSM